MVGWSFSSLVLGVMGNSSARYLYYPWTISKSIHVFSWLMIVGVVEGRERRGQSDRDIIGVSGSLRRPKRALLGTFRR